MGGSVDREVLERHLGLDLPAHVQYGRWIRDILLHGNLGISLDSGLPVTPMILSRLATTVELGLLALAMAMLISIPIGIFSAIRQDSVGDYIGRSIAIIFIAVPSFWIATMIILYPSIW